MKDLRKVISWLLFILWIALIFCLSDQPATGSNKLSEGITQLIIEKVEKIVPDVSFDLRDFNHIIRKNAHFFAYLILGILALNMLRNIGIKGYRGIPLALMICALYAISDEFHQIFVPGRSGNVKDVIIDSSGAFVGIVLCNCLCRIKRRS